MCNCQACPWLAKVVSAHDVLQVGWVSNHVCVTSATFMLPMGVACVTPSTNHVWLVALFTDPMSLGTHSLVPRVNSNLSDLIGYVFPLVDANPVTNQYASCDVVLRTYNHWKRDLMRIWAWSKPCQRCLSSK